MTKTARSFLKDGLNIRLHRIFYTTKLQLLMAVHASRDTGHFKNQIIVSLKILLCICSHHERLSMVYFINFQ